MFSPSFLHRIGERDEPPTAGEADAEALAVLLEAAGQVALERAGAILDERIPE